MHCHLRPSHQSFSALIATPVLHHSTNQQKRAMHRRVINDSAHFSAQLSEEAITRNVAQFFQRWEQTIPYFGAIGQSRAFSAMLHLVESIDFNDSATSADHCCT